MRIVRRALLTAAVTASTAGLGLAQQGNTGTTGTATPTGTTATSSTIGPTGATTTTSTATGTTGSTGTTSTTGLGATQATAFNTSSLLDTSLGSQIAAGSLQPSNILGKYYAEVRFQGRAGATPGGSPGGFGATPILQTGTTTGAAGRTGATGRAGAAAFGTTNTGNFTTTTKAQIVALPRQISYTAQVRFATPMLTPAKVHTEARAAVDRSTMIANAAGIEVLGEGPLVTLRGAVASEDEARLAEGIVRLTPGVRDVKNELRYPTPQP